eukprot:3777318-Rhodomonas_salina.1
MPDTDVACVRRAWVGSCQRGSTSGPGQATGASVEGGPSMGGAWSILVPMLVLKRLHSGTNASAEMGLCLYQAADAARLFHLPRLRVHWYSPACPPTHSLRHVRR